jgi:hypothetical protein
LLLLLLAMGAVLVQPLPLLQHLARAVQPQPIGPFQLLPNCQWKSI